MRYRTFWLTWPNGDNPTTCSPPSWLLPANVSSFCGSPSLLLGHLVLVYVLQAYNTPCLYFILLFCFSVLLPHQHLGVGFWLHTDTHTDKNLKAEHITVMGKNLALSSSSSCKHVAMMIITYFQNLQLELQVTFFFLWPFVLQTPLKLPRLTALIHSLCCIQMYVAYSIQSLLHL